MAACVAGTEKGLCDCGLLGRPLSAQNGLNAGAVEWTPINTYRFTSAPAREVTRAEHGKVYAGGTGAHTHTNRHSLNTPAIGGYNEGPLCSSRWSL